MGGDLAKLTEAQRGLLYRIKLWAGAATSIELGCATREEDALRQKCRRQGLIYFEGGYWRLTDAGRRALEQSKEVGRG